MTNRGTMEVTSHDAHYISIKVSRQLLVYLLLLYSALALAMPDHACTHNTDIRHFYNTTMCQKHNIMERDVRIVHGREKIQESVDDDDDDGDVDIDPDEQPLASYPPPSTAQSSANCGACRPREQLRQQSLEMIKSEILSKLGMSQPPNLSGKYRPESGVNHILANYDYDKNNQKYQLRRHGHTQHSSSSTSGLRWVAPEDDSFQMQGDAPDSSGSSKTSTKDFGDRSSHVGSQINSSHNRYSETQPFQEGEVLVEEEDDYHVRTVKVVAFSFPHPTLRHKHPDLQYFQFNEKARSNRVKRAVLWVYIRGSDPVNPKAPIPSGTHLNITIYKMHRTSQGKNNESPVVVPVIGRISQPIPTGPGSWINFEYLELEKLVGEWFRSPQQNMGLFINATDRQGTNLAVTSQHQADKLSAVPFLEVYLADGKKHRTRRTLGLDCNESSNETRCCRYQLTVDFESFGWDWIIAPKKYEANYCNGECPMVFMQKYPHTHLAQMSTGTKPRSGPCCAPRKLSSISMLYFDQSMNIMYGILPAMVVDRCGCM